MKFKLYSTKLCPYIWDKDSKLNEKVSLTLMTIVDTIEDSLKKDDISAFIKDSYIVGSIANYNWTEYSDIDVHILLDISKMDIGKDEAVAMFDAIKSNWNAKHDVRIKTHKVEIYFELGRLTLHSDAVYSISKDLWIKAPEYKEDIKFDKDEIRSKYNELKQTIETALKLKTSKDIESALEIVYNARESGLESKLEELSPANIAFRALRAKGYVDKLKKELVDLEDDALSVS